MDTLVDLSTIDSDELLEQLLNVLIQLEGPELSDESLAVPSTEATRPQDDPGYIAGGTSGDDDTERRYEEIQKRSTVVDDALATDYHKFYFAGEGDRNQSKFDFASNHLKIATKAKNPVVGKVLLVLLRIIIDIDKRDAARFIFYTVRHGRQYTYNGKVLALGTFPMSVIIDELSHKNNTYGQVFDPKRDGIYVSTELGWRRNLKIRRYIGDVAVWDVYRIAEYFGVDVPEPTYGYHD